MVYDNAKTGEVMIVEAKGGGSTRGVRKDNKKKRYAEQGTKEYRESIVLSMEESIYNLTKFNQKYDKNKLSKLNETFSRIKEAEDFELIKSIQVTQKLKSDSSLRESATIDFFFIGVSVFYEYYA